MVGDILKRLRKIYGYTGTELSKKLDISVSYLSEIENNKKSPSLEILQKCADIYGIKLSSLILLSENYSEAKERNKGDKFIRSMMINLINGLSRNAGELNEAK